MLRAESLWLSVSPAACCDHQWLHVEEAPRRQAKATWSWRLGKARERPYTIATEKAEFNTKGIGGSFLLQINIWISSVDQLPVSAVLPINQECNYPPELARLAQREIHSYLSPSQKRKNAVSRKSWTKRWAWAGFNPCVPSWQLGMPSIIAVHLLIIKTSNTNPICVVIQQCSATVVLKVKFVIALYLKYIAASIC